ncbi:MAG: Phospholipid ABC transporter permease protein MlaE, partial [uncultured Gemmatimonadaceae bacterium]
EHHRPAAPRRGAPPPRADRPAPRAGPRLRPRGTHGRGRVPRDRQARVLPARRRARDRGRGRHLRARDGPPDAGHRRGVAADRDHRRGVPRRGHRVPGLLPALRGRPALGARPPRARLDRARARAAAHRARARRPRGRAHDGGDRDDARHRADRRARDAGLRPGGVPRGAAHPRRARDAPGPRDHGQRDLDHHGVAHAHRRHPGDDARLHHRAPARLRALPGGVQPDQGRVLRRRDRLRLLLRGVHHGRGRRGRGPLDRARRGLLVDRDPRARRPHRRRLRPVHHRM